VPIPCAWPDGRSCRFNQVLRILFRGVDRVALEPPARSDLFLDGSPDWAGFRVPSHMISNFKILFHRLIPVNATSRGILIVFLAGFFL
jgi:hypothetical protein